MNDAITGIDAVSLAMKLEEARARVAARNIALASVPGSTALRFDSLGAQKILQAALADPEGFASAVHALARQDLQGRIRQAPEPSGISLDAEVAEVSAASGRYQALADVVSRQFAIMQMAIKGAK
ncbi:flagellar basal body rod protein FlgB [Fluviicoccus keumensis]|uniref:Flagellar basal body rod protein FlgB n=1 Tax=Fluviicoccus keumensis TaxID=1435465 RepID=A0A4Q7YP89_9GAMM|nr:flagellar biosynthesis protein FlgB [Fluviicoccus keumensis]RZU38505.1 flagellar basal body rod protein FlgB [Fluviicoccus keumensis]